MYMYLVSSSSPSNVVDTSDQLIHLYVQTQVWIGDILFWKMSVKLNELIHNTNSNCVENFKQKHVNTACVTTIGIQCSENLYTSQMLIDNQTETCISTQIFNSNFISDEFL